MKSILPGCGYDRSARELDNRPLNCRLRSGRHDLRGKYANELALADRKCDVHRIGTDDRRKHAGVGTDDVAARHGSPPDPPVDGRIDISIGEVDFSGLQCRFSPGQIALCCLLRGKPLVTYSDRCRACFQQFLGALQLKRGIFEQRLRTQLCGLCLLDRGFKGPLLDAVQRRAGLDQIAVLEQHIFQITRHTRTDINSFNCLDASDEAHRFSDGTFLCFDDADGRSPRLLSLCNRGGQTEG